MLHTKNFDDIYMCEVGAMMVGKIVNEKLKVTLKGAKRKATLNLVVAP